MSSDWLACSFGRCAASAVPALECRRGIKSCQFATHASFLSKKEYVVDAEARFKMRQRSLKLLPDRMR